MQGAPYNYNQINLATAPHTPSTVHVHNTQVAAYFRRYLMQKAISVFKWTLPTEWNRDYFLYTLYQYGYLAIIETDKFGVIPQQCGLSGHDVFYQPTHAVIANPLIKSPMLPRIGTNCTIIKLQPDYRGIIDKVSWYADLLALCMETSTANLINSKLSFVLSADQKSTAEAMKKLYDDIAAGNPATVINSKLKLDGKAGWELLTQNVRQNYITSDILSDMRKIEAMFETDIGIANANTDKRERLITDEVNANNEATKAIPALWLEELQDGCRRASEMFGISMNVDWRFKDEGNALDPRTIQL